MQLGRKSIGSSKNLDEAEYIRYMAETILWTNIYPTHAPRLKKLKKKYGSKTYKCLQRLRDSSLTTKKQ